MVWLWGHQLLTSGLTQDKYTGIEMSPPKPFYTLYYWKSLLSHLNTIIITQKWSKTLRHMSTSVTWHVAAHGNTWYKDTVSNFGLLLRQFWALGKTIRFPGKANIFHENFQNTFYSKSMTLLPEWFQPFKSIDLISVKVELQ